MENDASRGLFVEFRTQTDEDVIESRNKGYTVYKENEWVKIVVDSHSTVEKLVDDEIREKYRDVYEKFKAKTGSQLVGIPLEKAPFLTKPKVTMYNRNDIYTVEQLAESSDNRLEPIGLGTKEDRKKAKEYIAERKMKDPIDSLQKKNAELEARLRLLEEENTKLTSPKKNKSFEMEKTL